MINAESIGRRIRTLRKQKHISQERMALDLGFYQADISNMERATGNSGITDVVKLDMIAEYFGVSLISLLTEEEPAPTEPKAPVNVKLKEYEPNQYRIMAVSYKEVDGDCISELTLKAPTGKTQYVAFVEDNEGVHFYQAKDSMYEGLCENASNSFYHEKCIKNCFLSGDDYDDIFAKADQRWIDICRYLIYVATEDEKKVEPFVSNTQGKCFCEIEVPRPEREPEELIAVDLTDLSSVYRYRLMVEASIKNPSVYTDMDNLGKREKALAEKLKAACPSEEAYKIWKKDLIDAKIEIIMRTEKIVVCDYLFAGIGQYKEIMPESAVESFKCWINGNGSAFFCGVRPANKREIRTYAAQHIADELW